MIQSPLMREKFVMTTYFMAGIADVASTAVGLNAGFREVGFLGSRAVEIGNVDAAYVSRMAVTVGLIGIYALSKEHPGRFSFSIDKAIRIANVISWGIVALNTVQIARVLR